MAKSRCPSRQTRLIHANHAASSMKGDPEYRYILPVTSRGIVLVLHAPHSNTTIVARPNLFSRWETLPAPRYFKGGRVASESFKLYIFEGPQAHLEWSQRNGRLVDRIARFQSSWGGKQQVTIAVHEKLPAPAIVGLRTSPLEVRLFAFDSEIVSTIDASQCYCETEAHEIPHKLLDKIEQLNNSIHYPNPPSIGSPVWTEFDGRYMLPQTHLWGSALKAKQLYRHTMTDEELENLLDSLPNPVETLQPRTAQLAVLRIDLDAIKSLSYCVVCYRAPTFDCELCREVSYCGKACQERDECRHYAWWVDFGRPMIARLTLPSSGARLTRMSLKKKSELSR